jgi:type I restriction enzyme S subunit
MMNGWQRKQLGELADLKGRIGWRGLTAKEYKKSGPLFLSVHSLNYGDYVDFRDAFHISEERYIESPEIMLQKDDVLICKDGAGIGKLGIVGDLPDRTTINSSMLLIRSGKEILPKFLYRCLSSPYFQEIVNSRLNGATTPHLYQRDITEFPVVLPPLPEQQRIVGILDKAFEGIATAKANTEKSLENSQALFESHLLSVFSQGGKGWVQKRLDEICTFSSGGTPSKNNGSFWNGKIPWVSGRDMKSTQLSDALLHISQAAVDESSTRMAPAGSLLILVRGMGLAHGAQIAELMVPCAFNQDIKGMHPEPELKPRYLLFALRDRINSSDNILSNAAHGTLKIDTDELRNVTIPIPPKEQQERVVTTINALAKETQHLASIYERKLAALASLKRSLLHQAFSGNL